MFILDFIEEMAHPWEPICFPYLYTVNLMSIEVERELFIGYMDSIYILQEIWLLMMAKYA